MVDDLTHTTEQITSAIQDCGGSSTACVQDITNMANSLQNATDDVQAALADCKDLAHRNGKLQCIADVAKGVVSVTKCGEDIKDCVSDCKKSK